MKKILFISAFCIPIWMMSQCTNCGVGTNIPQSKFEIKGCGTTSTTSSFGVKNASSGADSLMFIIKDDGNVGIGVNAPTSKIHALTSGAKTANYTGYLLSNTSTSSTASINKYGLDIQSTGTWNGGSAVNTALNVNATGGTLNYAALFSGGRVGIGTTTPNDALEVNGNIRVGWTASSTVAWNYPPVNGYTAGMNLSSSGRGLNLFSSMADNGSFITLSTGATQTERMRILDGGNVGINITAPGRKLDILDASNPQMRLTYTSGSVYSDLQTTLNGYLYINPTGLRVGVGTNAPAAGLHDNLGTFRVSDPASATRLFQVNANQSALSGDVPAGVVYFSGITTSGEALSLIPNGGGTAGVKINAAVYNQSTWKSVWESQNVSSGNPSLLLVKSGGNVGIGTASPTANLAIVQTATATGVLKGINYTGAVNTNQTLSTEIPSVTITTAGRQWATGALTLQREFLITQPTYSFVGASTITDAANLAIAGAPVKSTNATITNTHGVLVQAGAVSTATNSYGLTVNAQTGATNNYAAAFLGGNVGIGTNAPKTSVDVDGAITLRASSVVNLTADNQVVTVGNRSSVRLSSDNATGANRTVVFTQGLQQGQVLIVEFTGTNQAELLDDGALNGGGNQRLSANLTLTQYDTMQLMWNGTDWVETGRSVN